MGIPKRRPASAERLATPASIRGVLFGASAAALGVAIQVANGTLTEESFFYLNVAAGLGLAALACPRAPARRPRLEPWLAGMLSVALAWQVGYLFVAPPAMYLRPDADGARLFLRGIGAAIVLAGGLLQSSRGGRVAFLAGLLTLHALLGMWVLRTSPEPHIDVFYFQRDSCNALLHGTNPYTITFPNIYGDATPFYGPGATWHGRLKFGFIYPPLSLFMALPGHLLGDYRYSQLFAIEAAAALMAFSSREKTAPLAAALFLMTPRSFFVLEQGWTEPFAVFLLAATVFCAHRARPAVPYVLGLLLCVKQYLVFACIPALFLVSRGDGRATRAFVLKTLATVLVVTLPLALWNARAFLDDIVMMQLRQPFRRDALSYLAWLARDRPVPLPAWVALAPTLLATALAWWRLPRTPSGFAGAVAIVMFTFIAFNKQAFANYYYFVIGALCCAVAAEPNPVAPSSA
jgi:hypothetical protein